MAERTRRADYEAIVAAVLIIMCAPPVLILVNRGIPPAACYEEASVWGLT
jgi:hypothetical protein